MFLQNGNVWMTFYSIQFYSNNLFFYSIFILPKGRGAGPEGRWVANPCFRKRSNETMHCDKVWVRVRTVCVMPDSPLKDLCSTLGLQQRETPSSPHDVL